MRAQTNPTNGAAFAKLYQRVPADQVARLTNFRRTHPPKQLKAGNSNWEYISCGRGEQALLLLPGALSIGESMFPLISAFENEYRVVAPSYALSVDMAGLCNGIARILEAERVDQVHVFGGSYGGLVAQYFVRRYSERVCSVVLSHTFVMSSRYARPLWVVGKLFPALPNSLLMPILRLRFEKILISALRAAKHPEMEFWRAYLNESIASKLMKEVFIHQNKSLVWCAQQPQFAPDDLKDWPGKILIIESDDDPAIRPKDRSFLRSTYPEAQVHTFHNAGHASSILKREEAIAVIRDFLNTA